jgi:hypothetical protein
VVGARSLTFNQKTNALILSNHETAPAVNENKDQFKKVS